MLADRNVKGAGALQISDWQREAKNGRCEQVDGQRDMQIDGWRGGQTGRHTDKQTKTGRWTYVSVLIYAPMQMDYLSDTD